MFTVIHDFADLQDGGYIYRAGDTFPRDGKKVSKERTKELSTAKNKIGKPLIVEKAEETLPEGVTAVDLFEEEPVKKKK